MYFFYLNTCLSNADIKEAPTDIHRAPLKRCTSLYKEAAPYATAVNSISHNGNDPTELAPVISSYPTSSTPTILYMDVAQTYYVVAL